MKPASRPWILALLAAWLPAKAIGREMDGKWYGNLKCQENRILTTRYPLPEPLSREAISHDLLPHPARSDSSAEVPCTAFAKVWPVQKRPSVLAFLIVNAYSRKGGGEIDSSPTLRIGMYRKDADGRYRLAAATASPVELGGSQDNLELDLAPYKIRPDDYAFGMREKYRLESEESGTQSDYENVFLELYRVDGNAIAPILNTLMVSHYSLCCVPDDEGVRNPVESGSRASALISVSPVKTKGFFDLKKKSGGKSAVLKWNGAGYDLEGTDPVEDVNSGIPLE